MAAFGALAVVGAAWAAGSGSSACVPGTSCGAVTSGGGSGGSGGGGGGGGGGGQSTGTLPVSTTPAPARTLPARPLPTLKLSAVALDFGHTLVVTGTVADGVAGQPVDILSQSCGFSAPRVIAHPKLGAHGTFSFRLEPLRNAVFAVRYAGQTSHWAPVRVRPTVALRPVRGGFAVDVSAGGGTFFSGQAVLQRFDTARHRWRSVGKAALKANSSPTALVAVSSAKVRAAVVHGSKVRASVSTATVGKCFLPAKSSPLGV